MIEAPLPLPLTPFLSGRISACITFSGFFSYPIIHHCFRSRVTDFWFVLFFRSFVNRLSAGVLRILAAYVWFMILGRQLPAGGYFDLI